MELTCLERLVCRGQGATGSFQESLGELHAVSVGTERHPPTAPAPPCLAACLGGWAGGGSR